MSQEISPVPGKGMLPQAKTNRHPREPRDIKVKEAHHPHDVFQISSKRSEQLASQMQELDVSKDEMTKYLSLLKELPGVREDKIEQVQRDLEQGHYGENALKATVDKLLRDFGI